MHSVRLARPVTGDERQLTHDAFGHCINSTQCFSPDGTKIVYDTRNDDSRLAANGQVRMVDTQTGDDLLLYETEHQTEYGPGAGAATFSPDGRQVLFLGGIQNACKENPYSFTRRTGIGIALDKPGVPIWMDARDIQPPFTSGALRGGTHAHTWTGDGQMISFTYNDHILAEAASTGESVIDTRTVGIMFHRKVVVTNADNVENKNGNWFSVLIAAVTKDPQPGSDQVSKAFDECWIGADGYLRPDGTRQKKAIAFQGHVADETGKMRTSIFVVDIPDNLEVITPGLSSGTSRTLPGTLPGIKQRRITGDQIDISPTPRHWLRSTPDGSLMGFLKADSSGIIQLWGISPNGGEARQLTFLSSSISGPFNFSADGDYAAYLSDGKVTVTRLRDAKTFTLTARRDSVDPVGAVVWSPKENELAYNAYVKDDRGRFLQIFLVKFKEED